MHLLSLYCDHHEKDKRVKEMLKTGNELNEIVVFFLFKRVCEWFAVECRDKL